MAISADKRKLWERQKGESRQAYAAFCVYRDLGTQRSLAVVAKEVTKSLQLMKRWSAKWQWGGRTKAYDDYLDAQRRARLEAARTEIEDAELADYRRQLERWYEVWEQSPKFQQKARQFVKGQAGEPDREIVTIQLEISDWRDMTRWRKEIADQARRVVGLPEKIVKDDHSGAQVITIKYDSANGNTAQPLPAPGKHRLQSGAVQNSGDRETVGEDHARSNDSDTDGA